MGALGRSCGCRTTGAQAGLAPGRRMCCRGPGRASHQVPGAGSGGAVPGRSSFISTQGLAPEQSRDLGKPLEMAQPSEGPGRHWKKRGSGGSPCPAWGTGGRVLCTAQPCSSLPPCQRDLIWGGSNKGTVSRCPAVRMVCRGSTLQRMGVGGQEDAPGQGHSLSRHGRRTASHSRCRLPGAGLGTVPRPWGRGRPRSPAMGPPRSPQGGGGGPEPSRRCRGAKPVGGSVWERERGGPTPGRSPAPR